MVAHTNDRTRRGKWCALFGCTIIDAQTQDADKLIRSGKAVRVDEDGNIMSHHDDDLTTSDVDTNGSDEIAEAVDGVTSVSAESDDDTNANASQEVSEAVQTEADQTQQAEADEAPKAPTS